MSKAKFKSNVPSVSGAVVSMCVYRERIIVACQYHIYELINDELVLMKFKPIDDKEPKFGEEIKI